MPRSAFDLTKDAPPEDAIANLAAISGTPPAVSEPEPVPPPKPEPKFPLGTKVKAEGRRGIGVVVDPRYGDDGADWVWVQFDNDYYDQHRWQIGKVRKASRADLIGVYLGRRMHLTATLIGVPLLALIFAATWLIDTFPLARVISGYIFGGAGILVCFTVCGWFAGWCGIILFRWARAGFPI